MKEFLKIVPKSLDAFHISHLESYGVKVPPILYEQFKKYTRHTFSNHKNDLQCSVALGYREVGLKLDDVVAGRITEGGIRSSKDPVRLDAVADRDKIEKILFPLVKGTLNKL